MKKIKELFKINTVLLMSLSNYICIRYMQLEILFQLRPITGVIKLILIEMQRVFIFRVCLSVCGTGEVHATVLGKSSWLDKNYSMNSAYVGQRRTLDLYPQKFVFNALFQELQTVQFLENWFPIFKENQLSPPEWQRVCQILQGRKRNLFFHFYVDSWH